MTTLAILYDLCSFSRERPCLVHDAKYIMGPFLGNSLSAQLVAIDKIPHPRSGLHICYPARLREFQSIFNRLAPAKSRLVIGV